MTNREKFEEIFGRRIRWSDALHPQNLALRSIQLDRVDCAEEWLNEEYYVPTAMVREEYEKVYEDGLKANKWILCSERLPEKEFNLYIVTYKINAEDFRTGISEFYHGTWSVKPNREVIAWMPLPEPRKKVKA